MVPNVHSEIATKLDFAAGDNDAITFVKMGKYISDINKIYGTSVGLLSEEIEEFSPAAYDIADIINEAEETGIRQNEYFELDETLPMFKPELIYLDGDHTHPYELYNYFLRQSQS